MQPVPIQNFIEKLALRLTEPLPGMSAHADAAPLPGRLKENPAYDHAEASVMILIMDSEQGPFFPLITRQSHPKDPHKGQVSLPGGKKDPADPNLAFTALRETQEEIGLPAQNIQIVGSLSPLYIPVSKFLVNPFVGWYDGPHDFRIEHAEVQSLLKCPLQDLRNPNLYSHREMQTSYAQSIRVKGFELDGAWVWGATAMILKEFAWILQEIQAGLDS